tara:strand:+ start:565 stop:1452 length:888 start_codon:yes stop_codon:yes gene_type:complete
MKYLKLIRIENLVIMVIVQYLIRYSLIIPVYGKSSVLGDLEFALLLSSILLISAGGYVINDYFDIQVDSENEKALVGRSILRRIALILHILLTTSGVILGFIIASTLGSMLLGFIMILSAFLLWEYNLRLKKKGLIRNLIIALLSSIFVAIIPAFEIYPKYYVIESQQTIVFVCVYSIFAFISSLMNEIIKDFISMEADKKFKTPSLPNQWGIKKTKEFVKWLSILSVCGIISIVLTEFILQSHILFYAFFLLILPLFLLNILIYKAESKEDYIKISKLNKFIIVAGISSMYFFI